MNLFPLLQLAVATVAAFVVVACDEPVPRTARSGPSAGAGAAAAAAPATLPPQPVPDPSLPAASSASSGSTAATPTAQDSEAAAPMRRLTPADEASAMPKPNQANNHSSPALDSSGRQ